MQRHKWILGILLLAILATAGCTVSSTQAPAASSQSPNSTEPPLGGGSKQIGTYTVTLFSSPNPPIRGSNVLQALVVDASNQPVKDAAVSFDIDMTTMSHGKNVVAARLTNNGRYAATLAFAMPGPWRVIVGIQRAGQPPVSDRFNFSVNLR